MRLALLFSWTVLLLGASALGQGAAAETAQAQDWLTQGPADAAVPAVRVDGASIVAPPWSPDGGRPAHAGAPGRRYPSHTRSLLPCPALAWKSARHRPWSRHGAHIPRMGDEPPPSAPR